MADRKGYPSEVHRNRVRNREVVGFGEGKENGVVSGRRFLEVWGKICGFT